MKEILEKLEACFDRLQNLQIKPTLSNMEILVQTEYDLRDVYEKLKESEGKNNGAEGRTKIDPDGRNND